MKKLVQLLIIFLLFSVKIYSQCDTSNYGTIVISEIYFDTRYSEDISRRYHTFGEYIELYNSSNEDINLHGWVISDNHTSFRFNSEDHLNNGNNTLIIKAGGFKIIAYNGYHMYNTNYASPNIGGRSKFLELFPIPQSVNINPEEDIILQNTMVLYNNLDKVRLTTPQGKIIDEVSYNNNNQRIFTNADPLDFLQIQQYTINISPRIENGDGGIFNGAIGDILFYHPVLLPDGSVVLVPDDEPTQTDNGKASIFRSDVSSFYSDNPIVYDRGYIATPMELPSGMNIPPRPLDPFLFYIPNYDDNHNKTESFSYDIKSGLMDGYSKSYFDDFGRPTVSMSKDFNDPGSIWGSEILYDSFGRKSKESFPSPICVQMTKINFLSDPIIKANILDKYYSNNNTIEPYQATAEQAFNEINYDTLNPGNIINSVGGNKIQVNPTTSEWKTGYSFTIPAAQEMYYAYGANHFNDNRNAEYYMDNVEDRTYPAYDGLGLTSYWIKIINADSDLIPIASFPFTTMPPGGILIYVKANSSLEIGKIYKMTHTGNTFYAQILREPSGFRNVVFQLSIPADILGGNWENYSNAVGYYDSIGFEQQIDTVLLNTNNIIAGLKCVKTVLRDANGTEDVVFTDADGKSMASAKSGGTNQYPVTSLIGSQGFVDIHLPQGCETTLTYIGSPSLYNVYNLKTGNLLSFSEMTNMLAGVYRVELKGNTKPLPLVYIDKSDGSIHSVSSNSKGVEYFVNYYDYSLNIYNKVGQLIKTVQPKGYEDNTSIVLQPLHMQASSTGHSSTFLYNNQYQVESADNTDQGENKVAYKTNGQIRFTQSPLQSDTKVSYVNYDSYGRSIETGILTSNVSGIWLMAKGSTDSDLLLSDPNISKSEQVFAIYDYPGNNETSLSSTLFGSLPTLPGNYMQKNLSGKIAITIKADTVNSIINSATWYSYDAYGRIEWVVQYNPDLNFKTIDYVYDYKGNLEQSIYQRDSSIDKFTHKYYYDINNSIIKVETASNSNPFTIDAEYTYYKSGELKRTNIAQGGQGLDYVYTLGGMLKSINHPSLDQNKDPGHDNNDLFGLSLDYYKGDYKRETSTGGVNDFETQLTTGSDYVGNIKAARWANKMMDFDPSTGSIIPKAYKYNYDRNSWLTEARFGTTTSNGSITTAVFPNLGIHYEGNLQYDENGNIQTLKRTDSNGTLVDNLAYNYTTGTNQLNIVTDSLTPLTPTDSSDLEGTTTYQYNLNGQLIHNVQANLHYFYNATGLVDKITNGTSIIVQYYYNERGQRIKKDSYDTNTFAYISSDYYVYDLAGNVISIYNKTVSAPSIVQKELPIYGTSRLGVYFKGTPDIRRYEITDHLGNVRGVIQYNGSQYTLNSYTDFYPFGEKLTNRNYWNYYRFLFQGQELDPETGLENFSLRQWDGRIGRWLTVDPQGQYDSPYLGMGNNPISMVDPDGGWAGGHGYGRGGASSAEYARFTKNMGISLWNVAKSLFNSIWYIGDTVDGLAAVTETSIAASGVFGGVPNNPYLNTLLYDSWGYNSNTNGTLIGISNAIDNYGQRLSSKDPNVSEVAFGEGVFGIFAGEGIGALSKLSSVRLLNKVRVGTPAIGAGSATPLLEAATKGVTSNLPTQIHHFATNKHSVFTKQMAGIADEFGLSLNGAWNKQALPHLGRHPNAYHNFVLDGMQKARAGAGGSQAEFLNLFNQYVKQPVIQNPGLLRKSGW
jgi:RHS repeat-associated protein